MNHKHPPAPAGRSRAGSLPPPQPRGDTELLEGPQVRLDAGTAGGLGPGDDVIELNHGHERTDIARVCHTNDPGTSAPCDEAELAFATKYGVYYLIWHHFIPR
jgi:hypothetical protein